MRSDTVTKGKQQAPHRSLFNALGLTEEEMNRPLVSSTVPLSVEFSASAQLNPLAGNSAALPPLSTPFAEKATSEPGVYESPLGETDA